MDGWHFGFPNSWLIELSGFRDTKCVWEWNVKCLVRKEGKGDYNFYKFLPYNCYKSHNYLIWIDLKIFFQKLSKYSFLCKKWSQNPLRAEMGKLEWQIRRQPVEKCRHQRLTLLTLYCTFHHRQSLNIDQIINIFQALFQDWKFTFFDKLKIFLPPWKSSCGCSWRNSLVCKRHFFFKRLTFFVGTMFSLVSLIETNFIGVNLYNFNVNTVALRHWQS